MERILTKNSCLNHGWRNDY